MNHLLPPALRAQLARINSMVVLVRQPDLIARSADHKVRVVPVAQWREHDVVWWGARISGEGRTYVVMLPGGQETHWRPGVWHPVDRVPSYVQRALFDWLRDHALETGPVQLAMLERKSA
jgi:hypothetical protein